MPPSPVLPPEWAPQSAVLLTWPHAGSDWAPLLTEVEPLYLALAKTIANYQGVVIACHNQALRQRVVDLLAREKVPAERCTLYVTPSNDTWARDHGPITVLEQGRPCLLDFRFNGWGGKFAAELDDAITANLHQAGAFGTTPMESLPWILEGGSIEVDGLGTLLTTRSCLLTPTRNPDLDEAAVEAILRRWLGVERVLWLANGQLAGDDTDGHIDTLARFCSPTTIAWQSCDDPHDPHYSPLQAMGKELAALRQRNGRPYQLLALPWPTPRYNEGRRLPATYANFLIINDAVLVPTYADPADEIALTVLAEAFPDRRIIGVPCLPLIQQNGSLHCITMQLPAGVVP